MKLAKPSVILFAILSAYSFMFLSGCGMQGDLYLPGSEDPNTSVKIKNQ